MICEHALITVTPGNADAFEAAFARAPAIFAQAGGCHGVELRRCLEEDHYLLIARWETLEDHTVGFRESPLFTQWRELVGPFFAEPPSPALRPRRLRRQERDGGPPHSGARRGRAGGPADAQSLEPEATASPQDHPERPRPKPTARRPRPRPCPAAARGHAAPRR